MSSEGSPLDAVPTAATLDELAEHVRAHTPADRGRVVLALRLIVVCLPKMRSKIVHDETTMQTIDR